MEELCNQMNTNISSLQKIVSALQDNDYVTSITPITSGDKTIGYTINFSKSGPVMIYHGQAGKDGVNGEDGKNGADGKDGHAPMLGVKMTSDGNYYWTIDGEWLLDDDGNKIRANGSDGENGKDGQDGTDGMDGITPQVKIANGYWHVSYDNGKTWTQLGKALGDNTPEMGIERDTDGLYYWTTNGEWVLDSEGNKIRANGQDGADGSNGEDGKDGQDGKDGKNGITPQLNIEDGYWYVSYDNGIQWTKLWKATGTDGKDGANGKDGDSMFSRVTYDDEFVYLVLADNTTTLMVPRKDDEFDITFVDGSDSAISAGETVTVSYTLSYGNEKTEVAVVPHNGWDAKVEKNGNTSGQIMITAPDPMKNGEVIVLASDGMEKTIMRKLVFDEGIVSIITQSYIVDSNPSQIKIQLSTNMNYSVRIPDDAKHWISVSDIQTKATMRDEIVILNISANIGATRSANITFVNSANKTLNTVTISQTGSIVANNEIWYVSSDGNIIEPVTTYFSGSIISNTYGNGRGLIVLEKELDSIWKYAFNDCTSLVEISMPNTIVSIGVGSFLGCSNLINVSIPNGVRTIGSAAFEHCRNLSTVNLPDSLETIDDYAFYGCSSLKAAELPNTVTTIGTDAFASCYSLEQFIVPESVVTLVVRVFSQCQNLTCVVMPSGLKTVGNLFPYCPNLKSVYFKSVVPPRIYTSLSIPAATIIYVPTESVEQYKSADRWSQLASQIVGYDFTE